MNLDISIGHRLIGDEKRRLAGGVEVLLDVLPPPVHLVYHQVVVDPHRESSRRLVGLLRLPVLGTELVALILQDRLNQQSVPRRPGYRPCHNRPEIIHSIHFIRVTSLKFTILRIKKIKGKPS